MNYDALASRVLEDGPEVTRAEARAMLEPDAAALMPLLEGSRRLRERAFGKEVQLLVLQNAKSGTCPEDCSFCSQSTRHQNEVEQYRVKDVEELVAGAREAAAIGAKRYCMVTATRGPSGGELETICEATRRIKAEVGIEVCASLGAVDDGAASRLAQAGVDRFNHNLETSRRHFPLVVGTHSFDSRVETIRAVRRAGIEACCGGIIGLGEEPDDRVDLAFELRALEVASLPVNFLDPRPGTPLADVARPSPEDCLRALAMFRFVHPTVDLRVAGGREKALGDKQGLALYPANSLFAGGYLTTGGQGYAEDLALIEDAGFRVSVIGP